MDFFINMTNGINNHFTVTEDPNAASGVNWPVELSRLANRQTGAPGIGRVEINSHGKPGGIMLKPVVNSGNVQQFAAALNRLIAPGSLIEILACSVAHFDIDEMQRGMGNTKRAHAAFELSRDLWWQKTATRVTPQAVVSLVRQAIKLGHALDVDCDNGALFCSTLAGATRSTVRAAMIPQLEQGEGSGDRMYDTPIGDWEGHVLDFGPGGAVHYAGFNRPRPVFRVNRLPIPGLPIPA